MKLREAIISAVAEVGTAAAGGALLGEVAYQESPNVFANLSHGVVVMGAAAVAEVVLIGFEINKLRHSGGETEN